MSDLLRLEQIASMAEDLRAALPDIEDIAERCWKSADKGFKVHMQIVRKYDEMLCDLQIDVNDLRDGIEAMKEAKDAYKED